MSDSTVRKGYRVKLRRELVNQYPIHVFCSIVSWIERDIFVDDNPKSDRELVAAVLNDYPGFVLDKMERIAI